MPPVGRFVLVSESDIPLYDPLTFYQQLMLDPRSLVKACGEYARPPQRLWKQGMEVGGGAAGLGRASSSFTVRAET